jgi:peptide/nickel transport system permease protein
MRKFGQTVKELWKDPMGRVGIVGILLVVLMAIFAPCVSRFPPDKMASLPKAPPSGMYWFGTDNYGRDIFSRILYGSRVSLQVGIIAVGIAASIGYVLGLVAGYFEGWIDRVIMCIMDILFAFPSILLAIFISAVLGRGLVNTMIAIGIVNIPVFARTVRASVISAKGLEYIANAKSVGIKTGAILLRHISPNVVAPFTVQATLALSSAILTEASMSFLGLGIQPPDPSWGSMLSESRAYMEQAPWMAVFPALFIIVTILLFNILGDSLRDVLDPKLKT